LKLPGRALGKVDEEGHGPAVGLLWKGTVASFSDASHRGVGGDLGVRPRGDVVLCGSACDEGCSDGKTAKRKKGKVSAHRLRGLVPLGRLGE
jgi:hypothetical protein